MVAELVHNFGYYESEIRKKEDNILMINYLQIN